MTINALHLNEEVCKIAANALVKKLKPDTIEAGEYDLSGTKVLVSFEGKLVKKPNEERTPTVSIPVKTVLALTLQKAGIQREHIESILVEAMTEAIELGEKGEDALAPFIKDYEQYEQRVKATLAQLPKVQVEGKVLTKGLEVKMEVVGQ
jgi:hypothetical protein